MFDSLLPYWTEFNKIRYEKHMALIDELNTLKTRRHAEAAAAAAAVASKSATAMSSKETEDVDFDEHAVLMRITCRIIFSFFVVSLLFFHLFLCFQFRKAKWRCHQYIKALKVRLVI